MIEVLVAVGDRVAVDQSLVTLESDKATMEIPSPSAGEVKSVAVKVGDKLSQGDLLLTLLPESSTATAGRRKYPSPPPRRPSRPRAPPPYPSRRRGACAGRGRAAPGPGVAAPGGHGRHRQGAKAPCQPGGAPLRPGAGVDLNQVKGSGPKGRILKDDVQGFVKQALSQGAPAGDLPFQLPAAPEVDFARFGEIETVPLSRIKKLSGRHLHRCWLTVPHVTQFDEADITELEAFRKAQKDAAAAQGVKLTFLPFLMKAVAAALTAMPSLKASLAPSGEELVVKKYTHVGVAVETANGLVVPVVRDVDKKGVFELARELMELSTKARDGKLLPGDMQGGCFSISSLGGIGGTAFTPIVNAPEVAILGVSRSETKPVWNGKEFVPRLMLPLSLSYDHRVVDGAEGVRFTSLLRELLGDIRRLLL